MSLNDYYCIEDFNGLQTTRKNMLKSLKIDHKTNEQEQHTKGIRMVGARYRIRQSTKVDRWAAKCTLQQSSIIRKIAEESPGTELDQRMEHRNCSNLGRQTKQYIEKRVHSANIQKAKKRKKDVSAHREVQSARFRQITTDRQTERD